MFNGYRYKKSWRFGSMIITQKWHHFMNNEIDTYEKRILSLISLPYSGQKMTFKYSLTYSLL